VDDGNAAPEARHGDSAGGVGFVIERQGFPVVVQERISRGYSIRYAPPRETASPSLVLSVLGYLCLSLSIDDLNLGAIRHK
jgi:hypothetical protein